MNCNCKTCKYNNGKQVVNKDEEPCYSCLTADEAFLKYETASSMTNADHIRTMTDEELTIFLAETSRCSEWCNLYEKCKTKTHDSYSVCLETWYEWLKEEYK